MRAQRRARTPAGADGARRPLGRSVLVTGTDTGVGKTVVAAALLVAAGRRGLRVAGFKPIETGVGSRRQGRDARALARAAGSAPGAAMGAIYSEALAPAVAAERARRTAPIEALGRQYERMRIEHDLTIVESAGGLLVPVTWDSSFADLAERWRLPLVIVSRAGLGALNHVLLTVLAARSRGLTTLAVVLNRGRGGDDLAERTNPAALRRLLPGIPIDRLPHVGEGSTTARAARLATRGRRELDRIVRACLGLSTRSAA